MDNKKNINNKDNVQKAVHNAGKIASNIVAPKVGGKVYDALSKTKLGNKIEKQAARTSPLNTLNKLKASPFNNISKNNQVLFNKQNQINNSNNNNRNNLDKEQKRKKEREEDKNNHPLSNMNSASGPKPNKEERKKEEKKHNGLPSIPNLAAKGINGVLRSFGINANIKGWQLSIVGIIFIVLLFILIIMIIVSAFLRPIIVVADILGIDNVGTSSSDSKRSKEEEKFYEEVEDIEEEYSEKNLDLDIPLIVSITLYAKPDVDVSECDPSDEECISENDTDDLYSSARDDIDEIVKNMISKEDGEERVKSDDEIKEWLRESDFIEEKLKSLDYKIPSNSDKLSELKEEFISECFSRRKFYETLFGLNNSNYSCEIGEYGDIVTADQLKSLSREQCINLLGPLASASYSSTNVFASVTLAQAIQEANCGKNTPPNSNNLFGIKCSKTKFSLSTWDGSCTQKVNTNEESTSGSTTTIKSSFRKYKSVNEAILDHSALLAQGSTYVKHKVVQASTPYEQIKRIKAAGYATDVDYAETISNVIKKYNLEKWDIVTGENDCIADSATLVPGSYHKKIVYFNQGDYPNNKYGSYGTIKSHGCGPTSMAIIVSSMTGQMHDPIEMTNFACNNGLCTSNGSSHAIAKVIGEKYGLKVSGEIPQDASGQQQVVDALSSGKSLVLTLQGPGLFTRGGHFLVLTGVTEDKKIQVADPGSRERTKQTYTMSEITRSQKKWWIITEP